MRWPWQVKRDREKEFMDASREWFAYERKAEANGFVKWTETRPPYGAWIEAQRREWPTRQVWQTGDENPLFNVGDLWWRPWTGETVDGSVIDQKAITLDAPQ